MADESKSNPRNELEDPPHSGSDAAGATQPPPAYASSAATEPPQTSESSAPALLHNTGHGLDSHALPPNLPPRSPSPLPPTVETNSSLKQKETSNDVIEARPPSPSEGKDAIVESEGESYLATVAFLIPFPSYDDANLKQKDIEKVPPFALYSPLHRRLEKPAEGEKESLVHKAQRRWQKEEDEAAKLTGIKSKAISLIGKAMDATKNSKIEFLIRTPEKKSLKELRILFPSQYSNEQLKADFTKFVQATKKGAIRNSALATAAVPFALVFDTVTFIPGPFEITAAWAASSWIGTQRATAISNGITSDKVTLGFSSNPMLYAFQYRLHELAWKHATKLVKAPKWQGEGNPRRGAELADILFKVLREQLGYDDSSYDTDRHRVGEDLEKQMEKAAKEFVKAIS